MYAGLIDISEISMLHHVLLCVHVKKLTKSNPNLIKLLMSFIIIYFYLLYTHSCAVHVINVLSHHLVNQWVISINDKTIITLKFYL